MAEGEAPPEPEEAPPLSEELFPDRKRAFEEIFADHDAEKVKAMAKEAKLALYPPDGDAVPSPSLTYAELDIDSVHAILNVLKRDYGPLFVGQGAFVDLGSGVGKAVLAAALLHPFQKVIGIEVLDPLNNAANECAGKFATAIASVFSEEEMNRKPEVVFLKGDFVDEIAGQLAPLAPECKVALAVATCYQERERFAMRDFAAKMPEGSLFVTFSQQLPSGDEEDWMQLSAEKMDMAWGAATVFIFKKQAPMVQSDDEEVVPPPPAS